MLAAMSRGEILQWLCRNGWSSDRRIEEKAREFISEAVAESKEEGYPVTSFEVVERFIASYGLLKLIHPSDPDNQLVTNPTGGYDGDFSEIAELSQELGKRLFRIGYDLPDGAIFVVAEDGEFYSIHHTGTYYLGGNEIEFFVNWVRGNLQSV
ncbi:SUKH-3 domain-containing protein [Streptomyces angustmyceticus]|uniref:SUKH-3 domain-containing protein n=1 Tax=Streptomyces angustmyceticus TaxID=285578 RepID=UPI0021AF8BCA|nr:SUKH-3 domain-containing protein [Streptomyces angustmyceticus]